MKRQFETGAVRDTDNGKLDYEGFLSPMVLEAFAKYMHKHRTMPDGSLRSSDDWQMGMPVDVYMKSAFRHFMEVWSLHRLGGSQDETVESLCALLFNVQGYLLEVLRNPTGEITMYDPLRELDNAQPSAKDYVTK